MVDSPTGKGYIGHMEKALQKQTMGNGFWAELGRGLLTVAIYATFTFTVLTGALWLGTYIAGLN